MEVYTLGLDNLYMKRKVQKHILPHFSGHLQMGCIFIRIGYEKSL